MEKTRAEIELRREQERLAHELQQIRMRRIKTVAKTAFTASCAVAFLIIYSLMVPPMYLYARMFIPLVIAAAGFYLVYTLDRTQAVKKFTIVYYDALIHFQSEPLFQSYKQFFLSLPEGALNEKEANSAPFLEFSFLMQGQKLWDRSKISYYKKSLEKLHPPRNWIYWNAIFQFKDSRLFSRFCEDYEEEELNSPYFLEYAFLRTRAKLTAEQEARKTQLEMSLLNRF